MGRVDAVIGGSKYSICVDDNTDPWRGDVETVVIQHGVARSADFWRPWVPALSRRYRVVRVDLRGHGHMATGQEGITWSDQLLVDDLRNVIDAVGGTRPVHLLGESTGGRVAARFAGVHPERLRSLALCSTPFGVIPDTATAESLPVEMDRIAWVDGMIRRRILSNREGADQRHWIIGQVALITSESLANVTRLSNAMSLTETVGLIALPTLVIAPRKGPLVDDADARSMVQALPNGRLAIIDSDVHEIYVECVDETVGAYKKFLSSL